MPFVSDRVCGNCCLLMYVIINTMKVIIEYEITATILNELAITLWYIPSTISIGRPRMKDKKCPSHNGVWERPVPNPLFFLLWAAIITIHTTERERENQPIIIHFWDTISISSVYNLIFFASSTSFTSSSSSSTSSLYYLTLLMCVCAICRHLSPLCPILRHMR